MNKYYLIVTILCLQINTAENSDFLSLNSDLEILEQTIANIEKINSIDINSLELELKSGILSENNQNIINNMLHALDISRTNTKEFCTIINNYLGPSFFFENINTPIETYIDYLPIFKVIYDIRMDIKLEQKTFVKIIIINNTDIEIKRIILPKINTYGQAINILEQVKKRKEIKNKQHLNSFFNQLPSIQDSETQELSKYL